MHWLAAFLLLSIGVAAAQPADCTAPEPAGPTLSLSLDLAGRNGVPSGTTGQAYADVPLAPPALACDDVPRPPADVLRGEPGDLLRGPGAPHVEVQTR